MVSGGEQLPSGEGGVFESRHRIIELHVIDAPGELTGLVAGLDAGGRGSGAGHHVGIGALAACMNGFRNRALTSWCQGRLRRRRD